MTFAVTSGRRRTSPGASPDRPLASESDIDSTLWQDPPADSLTAESEGDSAAGATAGIADNLADGPLGRAESKSDSPAKVGSGDPAEADEVRLDLRERAGIRTLDLPSASTAERRALVDLVIYAYDRTASAGIRARLTEGLAAVGVAVLTPDGEPFDPTRHEAGGIEPTADTQRNGLVAETELAGFVDRGAVIRDPVVVVYRMR